MHALHFTFGIGAFLAPLISGPFLSKEPAITNYSDRNETTYLQKELESSSWTIKTLYPIVGSYAIFTSFGFLFYFITDSWETLENSTEPEKLKKKEIKEKDSSSRLKMITVGLVAVFFFLYTGMELAFATFISVFSVKSSLQFTRLQGSNLTAVFWGIFATTRGCAIFVAIIAEPGVIMWSSLVSCMVGSLLLIVWAQSSSVILYTGTALMGVGMASIFATGFLWVEQRMTVTNKVSSVFILASSAGTNIFPVFVGQLVENWPMAFIYLTVGIVGACVLMFIVITLVAEKGLAQQKKGGI